MPQAVQSGRFPQCGKLFSTVWKNPVKFSTVWKKTAEIFHTMENFFPQYGKIRRNFPWHGSRGAAMKSCRVVVQCEGGLHLRVAAQIVKQVQAHRSQVHVRCAGCPRANACSIFELLKLGAARGTPLEVTVEGPDEEEALAAVAGSFADGSGI
jgi:phosphocarrier protein HPr